MLLVSFAFFHLPLQFENLYAFLANCLIRSGVTFNCRPSRLPTHSLTLVGRYARCDSWEIYDRTNLFNLTQCKMVVDIDWCLANALLLSKKFE